MHTETAKRHAQSHTPLKPSPRPGERAQAHHAKVPTLDTSDRKVCSFSRLNPTSASLAVPAVARTSQARQPEVRPQLPSCAPKACAAPAAAHNVLGTRHSPPAPPGTRTIAGQQHVGRLAAEGGSRPGEAQVGRVPLAACGSGSSETERQPYPNPRDAPNLRLTRPGARCPCCAGSSAPSPRNGLGVGRVLSEWGTTMQCT